MFTVITKGNEVRQYPDIDSIERSVEGPFLAIDNRSGSKVAFTEISPITWPFTATAGMQAIVDVKAGTLRFAYDGWPRAQAEFVVSEYVAPVTSAPVKPKAPVTKEEVMKLIDVWPHDDNIPVNKDVVDNWIWSRKGHKNVIINLVDAVHFKLVH